LIDVLNSCTTMSQPTPTIHAAAPAVIDKIIGQQQAVALLKVALAAYWNDRAAGRNPDFGSCLFVGPPGVGKTLFSQIIAHELAGPLKECLGQTLGVGEDIYTILMELPDDGVLFIDEAHLCSDYMQTFLFRAIEERKIYVPKGPISNKYTAVPISRFTAIMATTDDRISPLSTSPVLGPSPGQVKNGGVSGVRAGRHCPCGAAGRAGYDRRGWGHLCHRGDIPRLRPLTYA
jgi:Holliday junction resolvasome RuvABC ATP-dependent DNA helicase subunit